MNPQDNLRLALHLLEKLGNGSSPADIAALCSTDLDWHVPGDAGVLPWVGKKTGSKAIADFVRDTQTLLQRESFDIYDILSSNERAVILGHLRSRVQATSKLIDSAFAIVLTFSDGKLASFLMLEDSYAISKAAR